jgi:hypothetical protein
VCRLCDVNTHKHTHTQSERAASDVTGARSASEACAGPRELVAAAKDLKPSEPDVINSVRELAALCVRVCERESLYLVLSRLPFSIPCEFSANRLMLETDTQIESIKTLITTDGCFFFFGLVWFFVLKERVDGGRLQFLFKKSLGARGATWCFCHRVVFVPAAVFQAYPGDARVNCFF